MYVEATFTHLQVTSQFILILGLLAMNFRESWPKRRPMIMVSEPGDHCAIEPYMSCGKCRACAMGRNNCCENIRLFGIHVDGGMQEYLAVPIDLLHKSDRLSLDQLALVETLGIGAHAVKRSGITKGEEALVVGAGPIGIAVAQFASALGATRSHG